MNSSDGSPKIRTSTLTTPVSFIDLNELAKDRKTCNICGEAYSASGALRNYPVRLPCSCVYCYGDCDKWLSIYRDCPVCDAPFGDPVLARDSIDSQIRNFRRQCEVQAQLLAITKQAAALGLEQTQDSHRSASGSGEAKSNTDTARENVLAAITLLNAQPHQARDLKMKDLENALSLMDLRDEVTVKQLPEILESMSS